MRSHLTCARRKNFIIISFLSKIYMFFALVRFVFFLVVAGGLFFRRIMKKSSKSVLWELIVNNDDICFTHILPRLNGTDLKFLCGVNTETRKLIKRSSRKGELKKKFWIEEMSSISTLEVAWENKSLWPIGWRKDESWFCLQVAETNKLELLKWIREEKNVSSISSCPYTWRTHVSHGKCSHATSKVDIDDISSI